MSRKSVHQKKSNMASGGASRSVRGSSDEVLASGGGTRSVLGSSDEVLDSVASGGGTRSVLGSSDEVLDFECGICIKKGKHIYSNIFCKTCQDYLCSSCTDTHSRFPALKNHETVSTEDLQKICGICGACEKKEARCFCKECGTWICVKCKESHANFGDLKNHTIVSRNATYSDSTAPSDISMRLSKLSTKPVEKVLLSNRRSETKRQHHDGNQLADKRTKPSDVVATSSMPAKPSTDSPLAQHNSSNFLSYNTIKKIKEIKVKVSGNRTICGITGCCFMSGGELVLCDFNNNKIKLLDPSLSVVDLPGYPWDVAVVDSSNVIVTIPREKQLQFIQVIPSLKKGRTIDIGMLGRGVAVAAGKIYVSCYDFYEKVGEIRVYDLEGRDLGKRLGINPDGSNMFSCPRYVAVSRSGDKIFVSDRDTYTVSCLTSDGKIVYQYRDDELKSPSGSFVDDKDSVIVFGLGSHTVQVITSAGKKHKTLLSSEDGISGPWCVSFRPSDGTLVVGCYRSDKLLVYKMS